MLHHIKKIFGHKLSAIDGSIGHVKDFYFDDKTWAVRYLVADTGSWLTGQQVLLSPYCFGPFDQVKKILSLRLTKRQIENSPPIDQHRPVSRQYEENYYSYYGWPNYWEGSAVWGVDAYPGMLTSTPADRAAKYEYPKWDDIHLRSTKDIKGYHIEAIDGTIGTVQDFLVDDKSWVIRDLVVETGHWYSGKEIKIATAQIKRISAEESKVFVSLTLTEIRTTAENEVARSAA